MYIVLHTIAKRLNCKIATYHDVYQIGNGADGGVSDPKSPAPLYSYFNATFPTFHLNSFWGDER